MKRTIFSAILALLLTAGGSGFAQQKEASGQDQQKSSRYMDQEQGKQQVQKQDDQKKQKQASKRQTDRQKQEQAQRQTMERQQLSNVHPLVGRSVRSSRGDDIGEIENVVVSQDGQQIRVVLATGGFLGLGEKQVLVGLDELRLRPGANYVVYRGTEQELQDMSEYRPPEGAEYAQERRMRDRDIQRGYYEETGRRDVGEGYRTYEDRPYRGEGRYGQRTYREEGRYGGRAGMERQREYRGRYGMGPEGDRYDRGFHQQGQQRGQDRYREEGRRGDRQRMERQREYRDQYGRSPQEDRYERGYYREQQ